MISIVNAQVYCCEPINLIENYEKALNAEEKWEVHHRLETDLNLLKQDLIDKGLYYNRPANELIFLNPTEHRSLHHTGNETKKKQSDKKKEYYKTHSPWNKGMKNGLNGKCSPIKGKHKVWDNKELNIYHFE